MIVFTFGPTLCRTSRWSNIVSLHDKGDGVNLLCRT
jgi:hypothetical protein